MKLSKIIWISLLILSSCKKESETTPTIDNEKIFIGRGPEDIVLDTQDGIQRILASCNERNDKYPVFSEIVALNLLTNERTILTRKSEPAFLKFNPHGFYLQTVEGKKNLFIVNHYKDDSKVNSILVYELNGNELTFKKEYRSELMISPNEVCGLPNGGFYFTNDMGSDDLIQEQLLNKYGGSVVYCDAVGNCKYVEQKLAFPNGLEYKNNQLFLATTRNSALYKYDILADGSLTNKIKISTINGMDNIRWFNDKLTVSVHPDEIAFVKHSTNEKTFSPSWSYSIDIQNQTFELLYKNGGQEISGGSTSLEVNGYLYISQVFGDYLLKVKMED
jgi:hypothetical protein